MKHLLRPIYDREVEAKQRVRQLRNRGVKCKAEKLPAQPTRKRPIRWAVYYWTT